MHYLWNDMCYADRRNRHLGWFSCSYGLYVSCGRNGEMEHERSGSLYSGPLIGVVFGIVQGFCVGYLNIQPFIVTMAGMFFARGMTAVICTDQVSISSNEFL